MRRHYRAAYYQKEAVLIKSFCPVCHKKTEIMLIGSQINTYDHGTFFSYIENTPYCKCCGHTIYLSSVSTDNVMERMRAYNQAMLNKDRP